MLIEFFVRCKNPEIAEVIISYWKYSEYEGKKQKFFPDNYKFKINCLCHFCGPSLNIIDVIDDDFASKQLEKSQLFSLNS